MKLALDTEKKNNSWQLSPNSNRPSACIPLETTAT